MKSRLSARDGRGPERGRPRPQKRSNVAATSLVSEDVMERPFVSAGFVGWKLGMESCLSARDGRGPERGRPRPQKRSNVAATSLVCEDVMERPFVSAGSVG